VSQTSTWNIDDQSYLEDARISNEKPSAIFRLRGTYTPNAATSTLDALTAVSSIPISAVDVTAVLGLSIEPLEQILPQLSSLPSAIVKSSPSMTEDPTVLAERIVKHLFNYVSSFVSGEAGGGVTPETAVPMNIVAKWYDNFTRKVRAGGIGFLERED
jgi:hypothetical protein